MSRTIIFDCSVPCECGYLPKSPTQRGLQRAFSMHRRDGRCRLRRGTVARAASPSALLSPKNGRFDSRAALDVLMRVWR